AHRSYHTCNVSSSLRQKEACCSKILLHVLAVIDGGDNSLCLSASGSDCISGFAAPLNRRSLCSSATDIHYLTRCRFSSFVVSRRIMSDCISNPEIKNRKSNGPI